MSRNSGKDAGFTLHGCVIPAARLTPGLYLVATPIGNLGDISVRALQALAGADVILCEDTRHTGRLLEHFGIKNRLLAYHDHNADAMRPKVLEMLEAGKSLALATDAGMPVVSDPGMKLVRDAAAAGHGVHCLPGPSAALTALAVSGLASNRFLFAGFAPARGAARRKWLAGLADMEATVILFESPHRIVRALSDMAEIFGPRPAALCRELTKLHEEVIRLPLDELARHMAARASIRGEITLVIAPPQKGARETPTEDIRKALAEALKDQPPGKAAAQVARRFGLSRRDVHDMAMKLKNG